MDNKQIQSIDTLACTIVDLLNGINQSPAITTQSARFREVAIVDLRVMLETARKIIEITRPEMRSGIEALLAGSILDGTGTVPSLDVSDRKHLQIEAGQSLKGKNVLYVHADGVTMLRASNFESLQTKIGPDFKFSIPSSK